MTIPVLRAKVLSLSLIHIQKNGTPQYVLDNLDAFWETDDEEILKAREEFKKLYEKYKAQTDENAKKVIEAGGLFIVGTERHESRRIDNQLRGRAGRQGDPGAVSYTHLDISIFIYKKFCKIPFYFISQNAGLF